MKCYSSIKWFFMAFSITLLCALWGNSITSSAKTNLITKKEITYQKIEKEIKTSEGEPFMKFSISIPQIKGETEQIKKMNAYFEKELKKSEKMMKTEMKGFQKEYPDGLDGMVGSWFIKIRYVDSGKDWISFEKEEFVWANGPRYANAISGVTFDTATGNRLSLQDVIGGNKKEVREKLLQSLKRMKVWKESGFYGGKTEAKDILMKENVKAKNTFYVKGRLVYRVFSMYTLNRNTTIIKVKPCLK